MPSSLGGFNTLAIHAGQSPDPTTGAVIPPIYATSTFAQEGPGINKGFDYARSQNPTRFAYERAIAALEKGSDGFTDAFAFASGMAATSAVLDTLESGSHIIASNDLYGGTYRIFERVRKHSANLSISYADLSQPDTLDSLIQASTRLIWIESPTNPLLKLCDIQRISQKAKQQGLLVVVDNTFASPYLQNPIALGADFVVHSATKYINGHSDIIGGIVVTATEELGQKIGFIQNAVGAIASPFDCFLAHRGLKTLGLRMERHSSNALHLAQWLEQHPAIGRVIYPGLPSHPQHALAQQQMTGKGFGGIISIYLKGSTLEEAARFLKATQLFTLAESLGGIESLVNHPATMTHASIPEAIRLEHGITNQLVRLSVGIEEVEDLQRDLEQALQHIPL
jgi:cystathionine gamma-lyase